jgi:hypothetical protein
MFQIGLNPYGFAYAVGLQGLGTARVNPDGAGLDGFIATAREIGAIRIHAVSRVRRPMADGDAG